MMRVGVSLRNTPTVTVSAGRRFTISRASAGEICRGLGAKTMTFVQTTVHATHPIVAPLARCLVHVVFTLIAVPAAGEFDDVWFTLP